MSCVRSHPFVETDAPWACPGLCESLLGCQAETP